MKRSKHIQQRAETQLAERKNYKDLDILIAVNGLSVTHQKTLLTVEELV